MKILLVQPPVSGITVKNRIVEPLALEILATTVIDAHEVKILDLRIENTFKETLSDYKPEIIGYTCYICQVDIVKELAQKAKKWNPEVVNIVGGEQPTHVPEDFNEIYFDYMSIGDGEHAFPQLIRYIVEKGDFSNVTGGVLVGEKGLVFGKEREILCDLADSPMPARELTKKYRMFYKFLGWNNVAAVATSRGCKNRCNFCSIWKIRKGIIAQFSIDRVLQELESLKETNIYFCEAHSFQDISFMEELAFELEKRNIKKKYMAYVRVNAVVKNPDLFVRWHHLGLRRVFIGLEAVDDGKLKGLNKASNSSLNEQAIEILHSIGIEIIASFIINLDFDKKDFKTLSDWVIAHELTMPVFNVLTPLPGHELYHDNMDKLKKYPYSYYDFNHALLPTKLPKKDFYKEVGKLYSETYSSEISEGLKDKLNYDTAKMVMRKKVGKILSMNMDLIIKQEGI